MASQQHTHEHGHMPGSMPGQIEQAPTIVPPGSRGGSGVAENVNAQAAEIEHQNATAAAYMHNPPSHAQVQSQAAIDHATLANTHNNGGGGQGHTDRPRTAQSVGAATKISGHNNGGSSRKSKKHRSDNGKSRSVGGGGSVGVGEEHKTSGGLPSVMAGVKYATEMLSHSGTEIDEEAREHRKFHLHDLNHFKLFLDSEFDRAAWGRHRRRTHADRPARQPVQERARAGV
ncbi:hypothetical protein PYCC9005_000128 [Savitreella phatthalungensis]